MSVAAEIRAEMARQRISLSEMNKRTGYTKQKLSRMVNVEAQPLDIEATSTIAKALGTTAWELMRRAEVAKEKTATRDQ